tara:strand:- start:35 stop:373 length:339 start_codon:yes stop_codon:yes gene_type:complete
MNAPEETRWITPDQVAETMDGITRETYKELWGVLDKLPEVTQEMVEDGMTPADYAQIKSLARVWHHLSEDAQKNITKSIEEEEKQYDDEIDYTEQDRDAAASERIANIQNEY